jgi:hypothetical protein
MSSVLKGGDGGECFVLIESGVTCCDLPGSATLSRTEGGINGSIHAIIDGSLNPDTGAIGETRGR